MTIYVYKPGTRKHIFEGNLCAGAIYGEHAAEGETPLFKKISAGKKLFVYNSETYSWGYGLVEGVVFFPNKVALNLHWEQESWPEAPYAVRNAIVPGRVKVPAFSTPEEALEWFDDER